MPLWKRYVDDTFTLVKKNKINDVLKKINSFHPYIKFTHEVEKDNQIAFLDVLLKKRSDKGIETTVYRKPTNNSIYIHWNAYGPKQWKTGTLAGIIRRAYDICSTDENRENELNFIFKVFTEINGYPKALVRSMLRKTKEMFEMNSTGEADDVSENVKEETEDAPLIFKVPFRGDKGERLLNKMSRRLDSDLPKNLKFRIVHTGTKISKFFNIKDKVDDKHLSNFIYHHDCQNKKCKDGDYIGETARRKTRRTKEHAGKDKSSHIFLHSTKTKHPRAREENFKVLATNYQDRRKRKLAEAMYIRDLKPSLNKQKDSFKLALFA
jgi:hypothetical protein